MRLFSKIEVWKQKSNHQNKIFKKLTLQITWKRKNLNKIMAVLTKVRLSKRMILRLHQKTCQKLTIVTTSKTNFLRNRQPLNNQDLTCLQSTINKVQRKNKIQNKRKRTDRIHIRNLWLEVETKILRIAILHWTKISREYKKKNRMRKMRLMSKFKSKRRKRRKCKKSEKSRMTWMLWRERWGMRKMRNSLHFRKK